MLLYQQNDKERLSPISTSADESYRSPFAKDYSRLIHSPSFRRLVGKTQLFPGVESDFFRNRLTHSIEVSDIAKSIAEKLNEYDFKPNGFTDGLDLDLIKLSGLAHDIGHPPFGHIGEKALDLCMLSVGERFEGNAQTLRILSRIEKKDIIKKELYDVYGIADRKDYRVGLNLTYRSLASILKYDRVVSFPNSNPSQQQLENIKKENEMEKVVNPLFPNNEYKLAKGYYNDNAQLVSKIKSNVCPGHRFKGEEELKTVECYIMDLADDIAYTTYDLEDTFQAEFINAPDFFQNKNTFFEKILVEINSSIDYANKKGLSDNGAIARLSNIEDLQDIYLDVFSPYIPKIQIKDFKKYNTNESEQVLTSLKAITGFHRFSELMKKNGYIRTSISTDLVKYFMKNVIIKVNKKEPVLSKVFLRTDAFIRLEALKKFIQFSQILSPKLQIVEVRGKEIIKKIFFTLLDGGHKLLPNDYRTIYDNIDDTQKPRVICDYISGMTDRYAIEFYARLTSEKPETIFKPY